MNLQQVLEQFVQGMQQTGWLEYIAVVSGIASVWFSRIENIWVYPVGLVSTVIYVYLSLEGNLFGEASVNVYYTIMSVYGWWLWARRDTHQQHVVRVTHSTGREWMAQCLFFAACYGIIFLSLHFLKRMFAPQAIPWADALASASAFTGMWLMAKKKVESWYWWIITDFASIPLYFVKSYVFSSVYYLVLLIMAFWGLAEWQRRASARPVLQQDL
ncbi:MAG: nicotinamide mononucleotide transporter [Williamsia sp.]|nr:nicotinamide mononucleotide transporter [Williamsia sp.]